MSQTQAGMDAVEGQRELFLFILVGETSLAMSKCSTASQYMPGQSVSNSALRICLFSIA